VKNPHYGLFNSKKKIKMIGCRSFLWPSKAKVSILIDFQYASW